MLQCPRGFASPSHALLGGLEAKWRIVAQIASLTDGTSFFEIARAIEKPTVGHNQPRSHFSIGLGCDLSRARELVYSDGLDLDSPQAAVPVGVTCRMCDRKDCAQRAFPPVLQSLAPDSAGPGKLRVVGSE